MIWRARRAPPATSEMLGSSAIRAASVTAVWLGKDDNSPMHKMTGGIAPAELWRNFMSAALPRLNVQAIPGGRSPPPTQDVIGDILANTSGMSEGANITGQGGSETPDSAGEHPPPPPAPLPMP